MKRILIALYIICIAFIACTPSAEEQKRLTRAERQRLKTEDSLALKIAVMPTADCFPALVAKDRHLFDSTKVDVRLLGFTSQMDCDTALAGGSVEGAFSDLIRTECLVKKGTPLDYETSTNLHWTFVSNKKARVSKTAQLGDKSIGMTRFSATDFLCDKTLADLKNNAVAFRIQVNDIHIRLSMLLNNELDAAWLPEPQASEAVRQGNKCISNSQQYKLNLGVLAFRSKAKKDKRIREQVDAFIKGYNEACDSINKYGVGHYAQLLNRYCKIDATTFEKLDKLRYSHAQKPAKADVDVARKYAQNTK